MEVEKGVYMIERRTLEDVLNDLKEAENEYKEKCLKYGITEKVKRKKPTDEENLEQAEGQGEGQTEEVLTEETTENAEEISEN